MQGFINDGTMSTFITNASHRSLKGRIRTLIQHSQELKFLVGFFYFSGWRELYDALKDREDLVLKILVGLDTDLLRGQVLELAVPEAHQMTQQELVEHFFNSLRIALRDEALDTQDFYEQVAFFLRMLQEGRLHIRKTLEPNHAKLYLFRLDREGQLLMDKPGRFITGSSNLTRSGLSGQHEFNVEIGDYGWEAAEAYFDKLWETAIPLSEIPERKERIQRIIGRQTPVAAITPFEAYALVLKTYLEVMEQKALRPRIKQLMEDRGYKIYRYQEEAVQQALTVLDEYGGVILADVVGLGKSIIACWLARERGGRGIVICPPALIGDRDTPSGWHKYLKDFGLHDWEVFSSGKLEAVQQNLEKYGDDVHTIIVDEAHRFRNEDTESYERLSQICANRNVILLTATPFNNAPADILSLLKLFIPPGKSTLTLDEKLGNRFAHYNSEFHQLAFILRYARDDSPKQRRAERYYKELFNDDPPIQLARVRQRARQLAKEIRAVIEPVVIRRNRLDLKKDPVYSQEITNLSSVEDPKELFYELTPEQSDFYDRVIRDYFGEGSRFRGALYQPFAYEHGGGVEELEGEFTYQQQYNLYEFMRRLLVKRFESSFGAFARSVENFVRIHQIVLAFIRRTGQYVLDRALIEKIWEEDEETIEQALREFARQLETEDNPNSRHDRIYEIAKFRKKDAFLRDIQSDLELLEMIARQIEELRLVTNDPKRDRLIQAIRDIRTSDPQRKIIVFTEYQDTVAHLKEALRNAFQNRVLVAEGNLSKKFFSDLLRNFDASVPQEEWRDDYDILIATDKLSEGVNLNRAGAVINYDIPWNPTRVIQRLGRINRIGQKVFDTLFIYNFFPTEQGAAVVKSREIAAEKMFLIHNTLGEDAKIFDPDETPTAAELFNRVNRNPEELEEESLFTSIRQEFFQLQQQHPELAKQLENLAPRVKTAKASERNELLVFRRKGLQLFVHVVPDTQHSKPKVEAITLESALDRIRCAPNTPRLPLSPNFWNVYEVVKRYSERTRIPLSEHSIVSKARNNLNSALQCCEARLGNLASFVRTLLRDLKDFQTLPKYTLRRLAAVEMTKGVSEENLQKFIREVEHLRRVLGEDYLERIEKRVREMRTEIIVAVENIATANSP